MGNGDVDTESVLASKPVCTGKEAGFVRIRV